MAKKNPNVAGKVVLNITVMPSGRAKVDIASNDTGENALANCVRAKSRQWKYPAPEGGDATFKVTFTFKKM